MLLITVIKHFNSHSVIPCVSVPLPLTSTHPPHTHNTHTHTHTHTRSEWTTIVETEPTLRLSRDSCRTKTTTSKYKHSNQREENLNFQLLLGSSNPGHCVYRDSMYCIMLVGKCTYYICICECVKISYGVGVRLWCHINQSLY